MMLIALLTLAAAIHAQPLSQTAWSTVRCDQFETRCLREGGIVWMTPSRAGCACIYHLAVQGYSSEPVIRECDQLQLECDQTGGKFTPEVDGPGTCRCYYPVGHNELRKGTRLPTPTAGPGGKL